jgi:hypothetical protein
LVNMPTLEARITVSPIPNPTPAPASIPSKLIDLNILIDLTFLLAFAPALLTKPLQPPLKSILKKKREVVISSDNDDKSDLDNGEKEDLSGDSNYRPGRPLKRKGNRGQFKKARTE